MANQIEARRAVQAALVAVYPRVFFQAADDKADYPYLVFDLPNSVDDGGMENFVLEVDGWDAPADGDTTPLEAMMSSADAALHKQVLRGNGVGLVIYRDNRLTVPDDDKRIRRRKYVYQVRVFGGG